jgi:hypothetical protein
MPRDMHTGPDLVPLSAARSTSDIGACIGTTIVIGELP